MAYDLPPPPPGYPPPPSPDAPYPGAPVGWQSLAPVQPDPWQVAALAWHQPSPPLAPPVGTYPPTAEQQAAIDAFMRGESFKIIAFAGTGKTDTLDRLTRASRRRGLALAYNKAAAADMRARFHDSCKCRTMHSVAQEYCIKAGYNGTRVHTEFYASKYPHTRRLTRVEKDLVSGGLKRFQYSNDTEPLLKHVPNPNREIVNPKLHMSMQEVRILQEKAFKHIQQIWSEQQDPHRDTPMGGDAYVKIWALSKPILPYDYLLVDEAQDINPVFRAVIALQTCQVVVVGDPYQQLYGWRGAEDALATFDWPEMCLTQSWRFGAFMAGQASAVLRMLGEYRPLRGNPGRSTDIAEDGGETDATLCRTNAGCFDAAFLAIRSDRRVYADEALVKSMKAMCLDIERLERGEPAQSPELFGFTTMQELIDFSGTVEGGQLRTFVKLVGDFGANGLLMFLDEFLKTPEPGCLTISTVHKSKGLQWNSVRLGDDFKCGHQINDEERRLFYVAITRAKELLVVASMLLDEYQNPTPPPPPKRH